MSLAAPDPTDPAGLDDLLSVDEKAVRASVRQMLDKSVEPHIADWFERGSIPRDPRAHSGARLSGRPRHAPGWLWGARECLQQNMAWRVWRLRRQTRGCGHWCRSRGRSRCSRSGDGEVTSRSRSGCPRWRQVRSSAVSGSPSRTSALTQPACVRERGATGLTGSSMAGRCGSRTHLILTWRSCGRKQTRAFAVSSFAPTLQDSPPRRSSTSCRFEPLPRASSFSMEYGSPPQRCCPTCAASRGHCRA